MNILDDVAMNNKPLDMQTIYKLQNLASEAGIAIEDIADANDCGECHNWKELVDCLRDQFANGDRVPIDSATDIYDEANTIYADVVDVLSDLYQELFTVAKMYNEKNDYEYGFRDGIYHSMDMIELYISNVRDLRKNYIDNHIDNQ